MNPPYDERLEEDDIEEFYEIIGDTLKKKYAGYSAWLITSSMDGIKKVGLRTSRKMTLFNGKLECKFVKYEMYEGSKKQKSEEVFDRSFSGSLSTYLQLPRNRYFLQTRC